MSTPASPGGPAGARAAAKWGEGPAGRWARALFVFAALALGCFQLYSAAFFVLDVFLQRVVHLLFVLVLVFTALPAGRGPLPSRRALLWLDGLLLVLSAAVSLYIVVYYGDLVWRMGAPTRTDIVMGAIAIAVLVEATRRVVGPAMALIVLAFIAYAFAGPFLPGILTHRGFSFERTVYHLYLFQEGIYGLPLGVAATYVFLFILFGALLEKTGAGSFFMDLAYALTGRARGGPAKAAVVGSAFLGSISGSAIANAVTTGAFTIPMMKKVGYQPHEAAGVEAAASTGGQLLPPVMGAGAFIMAEFLGVPYVEIVRIAVIPALMYFLVVLLFVDILARRHGLRGLAPEDLPDLRHTLLAGFHYLVPLGLLLVLLFRHYTAISAGLYAMAALLAVSLLRRSSRPGWRDVLDVFQRAATNTLTVSVACAAAGIVVGIVGMTGLGLKFSSAMLAFSGQSLFLALVMVALASLVLGMGLPVTASYVVLVILAGPALGQLGLPLLTAHMIVFWYSQDSNVTPPVALAAFAAAGIAGASPLQSSLAAWKLAKGLYIIPFLMAYSPLLLDGSPYDVVLAVASGTLGLVSFAVALEGYLLRATTLLERGLMSFATVALLTPNQALDYAGMAAVAAVVLWQFLHRTTGPADLPSPAR